MQRDYFVSPQPFNTIVDFRAVLRPWLNGGRALTDDEIQHRRHLHNCLWSLSGTVEAELRDLRNDVHALRAQLGYLARHQRVQLPMPPPPP